MKKLKWIVAILAGAAVLVQFYRPPKNISTTPSANAMALQVAVPPPIQSVLQRSCNDCHSNNTVYPWYAEIQPLGWWLNKHIQDGKRGLNFDEFKSYRLMKQYRRFNDVVEQIKNDKMPLPSYLIIHTYAKLSAEEKDALVQWCGAMRDSMKAKYPVDSLERRPRK